MYYIYDNTNEVTETTTMYYGHTIFVVMCRYCPVNFNQVQLPDTDYNDISMLAAALWDSYQSEAWRVWHEDGARRTPITLPLNAALKMPSIRGVRRILMRKPRG